MHDNNGNVFAVHLFCRLRIHIRDIERVHYIYRNVCRVHDWKQMCRWRCATGGLHVYAWPLLAFRCCDDMRGHCRIVRELHSGQFMRWKLRISC